jgi:hypothetical protein
VANPIVVSFTSTSNGFGNLLGSTFITTNGGSYSFSVPSSGTLYYMVVTLNGTAKPACEVAGSQTSTTQGSPHQYYNGVATGSADSPITVTGNVTGLNISFSDTFPIPGVSGSVGYTGSLGTVSATHPIVILTYTDNTYATQAEQAVTITCNSTTYNRIDYNESAEYLLAFYDLAGTGVLAAGDPYVQLGSYSPGPYVGYPTVPTVAISFADTNIYP